MPEIRKVTFDGYVWKRMDSVIEYKIFWNGTIKSKKKLYLEKQDKVEGYNISETKLQNRKIKNTLKGKIEL